MELPQIGKKCAESSCQQLDFLPLTCKCGKTFCSEHFNQHAQICQLADNQAVDLRKIPEVFKCSHSECKETSVVSLLCDKCGKHFCIKHRHILGCSEKDPNELAAEREKYAAPIRQFNEAKVAVDKQLDNNLTEAKKKEKNRHMANKIQLMRIKNRATGSKIIPIADRVYFNVSHPKNVSEKVSPLYVSKIWTMGRVIDAVAMECKLQNNNNKTNEKKLRLFKKDNKTIVSTDMTVNLEYLLNNESVVDGESLIIEYVDEHCQFLE